MARTQTTNTMTAWYRPQAAGSNADTHAPLRPRPGPAWHRRDCRRPVSPEASTGCQALQSEGSGTGIPSPARTRKLHETLADAGIANMSTLQTSAERLPLADGSIDSITSNRVLNLVPDKRRAVAEMFRELYPDGRLQITDVDIDGPVTVGSSLEDAVRFQLAIGPAGEVFREAGEEAERQRTAIEGAMREALAPYHEDSGVVMPSSSWCITARRPEA
ncbi:MAG: methyltransferase domain-containing protein [Arhodomonas sp.]|nr:methyltransferase domain-containing protein [Arhodomonas sp.]